MIRWISSAVVAGCSLWLASEAAEPPPERKPIPITAAKRTAPVDFDREILPVLKGSCLACHSKSNQKGELMLESVEAMLKGGESGPVIVPKQPAKSLLLQLASHRGKPVMPPRDNKVNAANLTPEQLGLIQLWIEQGAKRGGGGVAEVKLGELPASLRSIYSVALSHDGQWAAASRGGTINTYDLLSGAELGPLSDPALKHGAHRDYVQALALSPDGMTLASGSFREVKIWSRETDAALTSEGRIGSTPLAHVKLDPQGGRLAWADRAGGLGISDAASWKTIRRMAPKGENILLLGWGGGGTQLLSAEASGRLRMWDSATGTVLAEYSGDSKLKQASINHAGNRVVMLFESGRMELLGVQNTRIESLNRWTLDAGRVALLSAPEPDAPEILALFEDGAVRTALTGKEKLSDLTRIASKPLRVARAAQGKRFAVWSEDRVLRVGFTDRGEWVHEIKTDPALEFRRAEADRQAAFFLEDLEFFKAGLTKVTKLLEEETSRKKKAQGAIEGLSKKVEETRKALETAQKNADDAKAIAEARRLKTREATTMATNFLEIVKGSVGSRIPESELNAFRDRILKESAAEAKQLEEKWITSSNALAKATMENKKAGEDKARGEEEVELASKAESKAQEVVEAAKHSMSAAEIRKSAAEKVKLDREEEALRPLPELEHLAFGARGQVLLALGKDGGLRRWRCEDGRAFSTRQASLAPVGTADLAQNGKWAWASGDGRVSVTRQHPGWVLSKTLVGQAGSGKRGAAPARIADRVNALRFSPDGRWLAVGSGEPSRGGELWIWGLPSFDVTGPLTKLHSDTILALEFSHDNRWLLTSGSDRFVRMVDTAKWDVARTFEGHSHHVLGVSWKQGDRVLASAGADSVVKLWDAASGERRKNVETFGKEVTVLGFVPWSSQFVAASGDGQVLLLKENGETVRALGRRYDFMYALAISADGRWAAGGGEEGELRIWDLATGKEIRTFGSEKPR